MRSPFLRLLVVTVLGLAWLGLPAAAAPLKPRVIVLTDVSTWEPDDHESLIRLLVHADLIEIEGLVFTTGWSFDNAEKHQSFMDIIHGVIDAYARDLPNLRQRSGQVGHTQDDRPQEIGYWPSPDYLRQRTMMGSKFRGKRFIGPDNDSPGSALIISQADEEDARPVWINVWGGGNTLAQAIWKVQQTRGRAELTEFLQRIPTYAVTDQDRHYDGSDGYEVSAHQWLRQEFSDDLLFIWDECAWKHQNGTGKARWAEYAEHIQGHGALGRQYPKYQYGVEGDTPAFLHVLPNGLNDPTQPRQAGWGGYSARGLGPDGKTVVFTNHDGAARAACEAYVQRFYAATFNNFAARMDWAEHGTGNRNPVVAVDGAPGIAILTRTPRPGETVEVDASASFDPDGDELDFTWWIQPEAGSYGSKIPLTNVNRPTVSVAVPADAGGTTFHLICEVTDQGEPRLSSYRRIIFSPAR